MDLKIQPYAWSSGSGEHLVKEKLFSLCSTSRTASSRSTMAAKSDGKRLRPSEVIKPGTATTKKHHFESFNQRVAKLSIDAIRKARRQDVEHGDLESTTSYFKTGLVHWKDVNLSGNYTAFAKEVESLCDSLPQILHHQQKLMDTLAYYLQKNDALSLEPLLNLLSHLAHDLGARFERHFARAVNLVTTIASGHQDVEVIEWSFSCLAWLFKFLSRLLVSDLRPVYDIMAPLLGKVQRKAYIARFAAEAMSFLIRKAALAFSKNQAPLSLIVSHIIDDYERTGIEQKDAAVYRYGIMNLFAGSMKGVGRDFHSCSKTIYERLLLHLKTSMSAELICGLTTNLVHHADAESFAPFLDMLLAHINSTSSLSLDEAAFSAELVFTICTVRKGSRISEWKPVISSVRALLRIYESSDHAVSCHTMISLQKAVACVLQMAPFDTLISISRVAMEDLSSSPASSFLTFCTFFSEMGRERFDTIVTPYFYKYLKLHWQDEEYRLLDVIPNLVKQDGNAHGQVSLDAEPCSRSWQERVVRDLESWDSHRGSVSLRNGRLTMLNFLSSDQATRDRMTASLRGRIDGLLSDDKIRSFHVDEHTLFTIGAGFRATMTLSHFDSEYSHQLWQRLRLASDHFGTMPLYIQNILLFLTKTNTEMSGENLEGLVSNVVPNLSSPSQDLRVASLNLLNLLYSKVHGHEADVLLTALAAEGLSLDLKSIRMGSMYLKHLSDRYNSVSSDPWLKEAIPYYCFGALNFRLTPLQDDATMALKSIYTIKSGQKPIEAIVCKWFESEPAINAEPKAASPDSSRPQALNEFQCSNSTYLDELFQSCLHKGEHAEEHLKTKFEMSHQICPRIPANARALALKVLSGVPLLAEQRSRRLIPLFLDWAKPENHEHISEDTFTDQITEDPGRPEIAKAGRLSRREGIMMLNVFASFVNPKVLFRSSEVFDTLLTLVANGDVEIQKSALKAIFTWKLDGVRPYEEILLNLLDEARFREEITIFLHNDEGSTLQSKHYDRIMPIIVRILFGKITTRSSSGSRTSQSVKRKVVFDVLCRFPDKHIQDFLRVALGNLRSLELDECSFRWHYSVNLSVTPRQTIGLLNMIKDMLGVMGSKLTFLWQPIMNAVLFCLLQSAKDLAGSTEAAASDNRMSTFLKDIRQLALRCLMLIFKDFPLDRLEPYLPLLFNEFITPRIDRLPIETAQSVSTMLQLFSTWASSPRTVLYLSKYDVRLLGLIVDCFGETSAKAEVKLFVLDQILKPIASLAIAERSNNVHKDQAIYNQVFGPYVDHILLTLGAELNDSPSKPVLNSSLELVSLISETVENSLHMKRMLELLSFLLDQPSNRVSPMSKGDLLQSIQRFIPLVELSMGEDLFQRIFRSVSSLFGYFKDRSNRLSLCKALDALALKAARLADVARLCHDLNSYSSTRLDEPDFDNRLKAFNAFDDNFMTCNDEGWWAPPIHNFLYFIKDEEEMAIRSSASSALCRFVEFAAQFSRNGMAHGSDLLKTVVLPALRDGASARSELVRFEYLSVMACVVRLSPNWTDVNDLSALLMNNDEEASFFNNVLHIQQHRRLRAIRRLATIADSGQLRSTNIAHFLIPLLEHFVLNQAEDSSAESLCSEAIVTIGALSRVLEWPQLRAIFRRYTAYIQTRPDLEKSVLRLLGILIEAIEDGAARKERKANETTTKDSSNSEDVLGTNGSLPSILSSTMPRQEKLNDDLNNNILPPLLAYVHHKDESTVSLRVPVAVAIVKLLKILPKQQFTERLPPLLTDICHILRSRAPESRDMARKTLTDISTLIGPDCFEFVLKELRGSLQRGYQLHVLSFTVHSILVATSPTFGPGDLDHCIPQVVSIIMDDTFGVVGSEKDAEEYVSKMKEVKASKSYDSMELIAKTISISNVKHLIRPVQNLLDEKLDAKRVKRIDELLRRIGAGLLRNGAIDSQETLIFCYELLQDGYKSNESASTITSQSQKKDQERERYLVDIQSSRKKMGHASSRSPQQHKITKFALDLLRVVIQKNETFQSPARLSPFMAAVGDALLGAHEEVQITAFRFLTTIIRVPMKELDVNANIYTSEAVKTIKNASSTNTELSQAALKLISAILLRKKQNPGMDDPNEDLGGAEIKDIELAYLLKRLKSDLEEPNQQGVTFNFLKAVLSCRIMIAEVYEIMDTIAAIMVTSQSQSTRDVARSLYYQFICRYPQSKSRSSKQLTFLVKNLDYKHVEGRQSVMEVIHLLINKATKNDNISSGDLAGIFLTPLALVLVNDDSSDCRRMSGLLIKSLYETADSENRQKMLNQLHNWLGLDDRPMVVRMSLQIFDLLFDVKSFDWPREALKDRLFQLLKTSLADIPAAEWEVIYFSIQVLAKICSAYPHELLNARCSKLWATVRGCASYPHAWVKLAASKLLWHYFAHFTDTNGEDQVELPLSGSGGLRLGAEEVVHTIVSSLRALKVPEVTEELSAQLVKNLVLLSELATNAHLQMPWSKRPTSLDDQAPPVADDSENSDADEQGDENANLPRKLVLQYVFERLSAIIRREPLTTKALSLVPKTAVLQLLSALCYRLSMPQLSPCISTILLPLYQVTDSLISTPFSTDQGFKDKHTSLVSSAQELLASLREKMGTESYVKEMARVSEDVKRRREGRRAKRRVEAIADPEKAGRDKIRKGEKKKMKRKERHGEYRSLRRGW